MGRRADLSILKDAMSGTFDRDGARTEDPTAAGDTPLPGPAMDWRTCGR
jgi:hypothetical protein